MKNQIQFKKLFASAFLLAVAGLLLSAQPATALLL